MRSRQAARGVVLVMVLLFLVLISMFSISAFRASSTNLRATHNMMVRQEAQSAAQWAIEDTISTLNFEATPSPPAVTKDVTGDGSNDYTVTQTVPNCSKIRFMMVAELPKDASTGFPSEDWKTCDSGQSGKAPGSGASGPGLIEMDAASAPGVTSKVTSYCAEAVWKIQASVSDPRTSTQVEVHQDVAVPHPIDKIDAICNRS